MNSLHVVITRALTSLARVLLKNSTRLQETYECLKLAFILAAEAELTSAGAKITDSRISIMTGVHRKDITRLRHRTNPPQFTADLLTRVIGHWQTDKRFCDENGEPKELSLKGGKNSFESLLYSISKELTVATVLFELERIGIITYTDNGARLLRQSYSPDDNTQYGFKLLSEDGNDLFSSVCENLNRSNQIPNLHARTTYDNIRPEHVAEIRRWLLKEGHEFHKRARDFISQFDQDINPDPQFSGKGLKIALTSFSHIRER